ncbi:MAG: energy transducer TonB [Cyclobacteriaceae bacterium]|nr:energy transducer TonB [Cyclobacteriaceae bacterium]
MKLSKVAILFWLSTIICLNSNAQKITFLNAYKHPIENTDRYEPCYYSVQSTFDRTINTKMFGLDSLLVSETLSHLDLEGKEIKKITVEYRDNELLKSHVEEDFVTGEKLSITYHDNGQLESKEKTKGEMIEEGDYYDREGHPRSKPVQTAPEPKDGLNGWHTYLAKTLNFPKEARKRKIEGTVYVVFEITPEGTIENIGVINPEQIHDSLVDEAMRVVWKYPHLWTPGKVDGENVRVNMRLPLRFRLS